MSFCQMENKILNQIVGDFKKNEISSNIALFYGLNYEINHHFREGHLMRFHADIEGE